MKFQTIEDAVGKTPLVALQRIAAAENSARGNIILGKLEGNNPAGSVKDRPALAMIRRAEERGDIKPGDTEPKLCITLNEHASPKIIFLFPIIVAHTYP